MNFSLLIALFPLVPVRRRAVHFVGRLLAGGAALVAGALAHAQSESAAITTYAQFWELQQAAGENEYPLRVRLRINYYDPEWKIIWATWDGNGCYVGPGDTPLAFQSGQLVELDGVARPGKQEIIWTRTKVKVLAESASVPLLALPDAIARPGDFDLKVIETTGLVSEQIDIDPTHERLELVSGDRNITLYVHLDARDPVPQWKNAFVRLQGVFSVKQDVVDKTLHFETWVARPEHIAVTSWLRDDPRFERPVTNSDHLVDRNPLELVRITGLVHSQVPGVSVTVRDDGGQVRLLTRQASGVKIGDRIEAIGFPVVDSVEPELRQSLYRPFDTSLLQSTVVTVGLPKLRLTEQVRELGFDEAALGYPVQLNGVVTWSDPETRSFFLQDGSGGIQVRLPANSPLSVPASSTGLSVTGHTQSGAFVPFVSCTGLANPMPRALPQSRLITLDQALTGAEYAQWIEMRGYVRAVNVEGSLARLGLTAPGGEFAARLPVDAELKKLVGTVIQIAGVCDAVVNDRHQIVGVQLWTPSRDQIQVKEPMPADLFQTPLRPLGSLLQFSAKNQLNQRTQISGQVLLHRPGEYLCLADGNDSLLVLSHQMEPLQPGDLVQVVGFPGNEGRRLVMREAVYRRTGHAPEPVAERLAFVDPPLSRLDGRLVHLEGVLLDAITEGLIMRLQLQSGNVLFEAVWERPGSSVSPPWPVGALLEVTGVYRIELDEYHQAHSFHLLVRSDRDIRVLRRPAWWTVAHVLWLALGLLATVLVITAWVVALARKNRLLRAAQRDLRDANNVLEERVERRTRDLKKEVTVREHSETTLAEERLRLRTLIDNLPVCLYIKDPGGRFVVGNRPLATMLGAADEAALIGKTVFDFLPPQVARALADEDQAVLASATPLAAREEATEIAGVHGWQSTTRLALRDRAGRITGLIGISQDITERKRSEAELEEAHRELLESSRKAGMAEVATGVLHNVGNVLNSVNVSATLIADQVHQTKAGNIAKLAEMFAEHQADLATFLTTDPRGRMIPGYLATLAQALVAEQETLATELEHLRQNVSHIKDIVAMQQAHAQTSGVIETVSVPDLVENALQVSANSFARHGIEIIRDYQVRPVISSDRHKIVQVLINIVRNAKQACVDAGRPDRRITVRIAGDEQWVRISVSDNGVGIPAENLDRIFSHGFTTRQTGHGFGLHSSALAAKDLGGRLAVQSDGPGLGATFTLELPGPPKLYVHENSIR